MVLVDNEVTRRQRRQFCEKGICGLASLLTPHETVAKHVLFAEHDEIGRGVTVIEGEDDHGSLTCRNAQGLLPAIRLYYRWCLMVRQQPFQPFAGTDRVAGNDGLGFGGVERFQMRGNCFIHIRLLRTLRREITRCADAEIDDGCRVGLCERGDKVRGVVCK